MDLFAMTRELPTTRQYGLSDLYSSFSYIKDAARTVIPLIPARRLILYLSAQAAPVPSNRINSAVSDYTLPTILQHIVSQRENEKGTFYITIEDGDSPYTRHPIMLTMSPGVMFM